MDASVSAFDSSGQRRNKMRNRVPVLFLQCLDLLQKARVFRLEVPCQLKAALASENKGDVNPQPLQCQQVSHIRGGRALFIGLLRASAHTTSGSKFSLAEPQPLTLGAEALPDPGLNDHFSEQHRLI